MLEDRYLILRFNRGDRRALHRIYDKYKDELVSLAAALLLDVSLAEDVVHDVFIAFLDSAKRFRLTGSLKGYLATCVANRARNVNKAAWRRHGTALDGGATAPPWMVCRRWPVKRPRPSKSRFSANSPGV